MILAHACLLLTSYLLSSIVCDQSKRLLGGRCAFSPAPGCSPNAMQAFRCKIWLQDVEGWSGKTAAVGPARQRRATLRAGSRAWSGGCWLLCCCSTNACYPRAPFHRAQHAKCRHRIIVLWLPPYSNPSSKFEAASNRHILNLCTQIRKVISDTMQPSHEA